MSKQLFEMISLCTNIAHRVSLATGQLLCLPTAKLKASSRAHGADLPRPVMAFGKLVPASLPKCSNQPV